MYWTITNELSFIFLLFLVILIWFTRACSIICRVDEASVLVLSWHKQYDWILCWQLYTLTSLQTNTWIATWRPTNGLYAYLLVFTVKKSNTQTKFEVIVCSGFFHMLSDWNGLVFPLDLIQGKTCAFYWGIIVGQFWNNFLGVGWSSFWTILSFFYCSFENFKRIKTYVTVANFHFFFS